MNRLLLTLMRVLAIPFVLLVVGLNLAHPWIHAFEAGGLDAILPWLDMMAVTYGGGSLVDWAKRRSHRHHAHEVTHG